MIDLHTLFNTENIDAKLLNHILSNNSQMIYSKSKYSGIGQINMRRSKLEMNLKILEALACHGKLKLTHIMYKANINCSVLKEYLDLLIQHKLVEKHISQSKRRVAYSITEKGFTALKTALQVNNSITIFEKTDAPNVIMLPNVHRRV